MRRDGTGRRERRERVRGLYVIADTATLAGRDLVASVAAALLGGAAIVQYRDKGGDPELRRAQADALRGLCRRHDALFIVNDDFELALACGADGVHLGRHDDAVALVRREHPELLVGASCYADLARAAQMSAAGADYLAFGSFRASPTKPDAVRADDEILRQARGRFDVPLVAIGGIVEQDVPHLLRCGADAIAVISAVFGQADPRRASAAFAGYFQQHEPATRETER